MGTLFDQKPRRYHRFDVNDDIIREIKDLQYIQKKTGLNYDQVLETCKMLELRRKNELYVANGDIHDEQMAGFGELIKQFIRDFNELYSTEHPQRPNVPPSDPDKAY